MGYIEKLMGTNEKPLYTTHQHAIVLLERIAGSLFAFIVFVVVAVALFMGSEVVRLGTADVPLGVLVGFIALFSLILPVIMLSRGVRRGRADGSVVSRVWLPVVMALLILVFAILAIAQVDPAITGFIAVLVALIPLANLVRGFLDWQNERYMITNRRVMEIKGIFNKLVRDSALEKVNDVELKQSVMGRLLGYGTVQIITGSDIGVNMFRRISNPVRFKREMLNAKEGLHGQVVDEFTPAPRQPSLETPATGPLPAVPAAGSSVGDRLIELAELRQKGLITEAEYDTKRRELLDQL